MSAVSGLGPSTSVSVDEQGCRHVRAEGELDLASAPALEQELSRACANGAPCVVLDLSALRFIDSTGVRAVLAGVVDARSRGCELSLLPGPAPVQRVFELTGLAELLPFRRR